MSITDLPLFSMLRTRMQGHQERQRVLAQNVANSDTRDFQPRDLAPLRFEQSGQSRSFEARTTGAAVNLEDEMLKVAANQMDYQAASSLYVKSLNLIKTAIGKR